VCLQFDFIPEEDLDKGRDKGADARKQLPVNRLFSAINPL
jgi:hypothetical protein